MCPLGTNLAPGFFHCHRFHELMFDLLIIVGTEMKNLSSFPYKN